MDQKTLKPEFTQWVCKICGAQAKKKQSDDTGYCPSCRQFVQLMQHNPNKQLHTFNTLANDLHQVKEELSEFLSEFSKQMRQLKELEGTVERINHLEDRIEDINRHMVNTLNEVKIPSGGEER